MLPDIGAREYFGETFVLYLSENRPHHEKESDKDGYGRIGEWEIRGD